MCDKIVMAGSKDTVDNVKAKIQDKFNIPSAAQKLVLRTTELLGGGIARYLEHEQEEITLHVCDTRAMQVLIATMAGRRCLLDMVPSLPVRVLKTRIQTMPGLQFLDMAQ